MNQTNRRAMTILFMTMFIVMVGFGVIMPILPFYAEKLGATATHLGLLFASYSVVQFFFAPIWGEMSDRVGRKPMILLGLAGFGISFILFGLANSLWMLFAARILGGALSAATLPTVMAYIADTTDTKSRGSGLGLMGAAMGMGMIFGPVLGGFLGEYSASLPFFFSGGLAFAVLIFAFFMLPESRSVEARTHARTQTRRNSLKDIVAALSSPIGFVLIIAFLATFASANLEGTFALFSQVHLGFGESEMGLVFGVMGVVMALSQGLLVGRFINRWGEERMIQVGLISSAIGYLLFLLTFNMVSIMGVMAIMGIGSAALNPAVNSLASKRTPPDQQGRVMGIVNAYNSLGRVFGPVVGGVVFDLLGYQWPYLVGSTLFFSIYIISFMLFARNRAKQQEPALQMTEGVAASLE
jgi:MFS transporter, DHA1 family, multidrug resistance protein